MINKTYKYIAFGKGTIAPVALEGKPCATERGAMLSAKKAAGKYPKDFDYVLVRLQANGEWARD